MSAELLREAAKVMRERAQVATEGPWYPDWDSGVYAMPDMTPDWVISGGSVTYDDTQHIASWHPAVALAVADWLDAEADVYATAERVEVPDGWSVRVSASTFGQAVQVARAYLGGAS